MQKVLPLILIGLGVFFLLAAILVGYVVFPKVVDNKITTQVQLKEGSITWNKWKNITTPIFIKYYLFNVTNPDEIIAGGKPILDEKGPYVYEQKRVKTIVKVDEEHDTVTYRQTITYFFRADLSGGRTVEDVFTVLNIPHAGFTTSPFAFRAEINEFAKNNDENLFIQRTVDEFLFKGYLQHTVKDISEKLLGGKVLLPDNMFAINYGKNGTPGPEYEVHRGVQESAQFGEIVKWDNQAHLSWWGGYHCNQINGTDGSIFPPFVKKDRILRMFSDELCRSLYLTYSREVSYNGIPGYRFTLPKEVLQRGTVNKDNECFCKNLGNAVVEEEEEKNDDFWGDEEETTPAPIEDLENGPKECRAGVILLAGCKGGKPIVASTPHFLFGEPTDVSKVEGLHPVEEKHETFIDLELNTGLVLQASKKIQINVQLKKTRSVRQMGKLTDVTFPVLWADESAAMTPETAEEFKDKLLSIFQITTISMWSVVGVSVVLVIIGIIILILRAKQSKYLP